MHIYRLGGEISKIYRLEFTPYNSNPSCRVREIHIESRLVNNINHWKEYVEYNFDKLENGYYNINNFGKFQRCINSAIEKPTLREHWNKLPRLAKFLLSGVLLILMSSTYQQITTPQSAQQNTERH